MIKKLDHIAIAVLNLEESVSRWESILHMENEGIEEIAERGVRLCHLKASEGASVELISALGVDSPVEKFLEQKGEGIHHFCFEVEDINQAIAELKSKGVRFVQERPVSGAGNSRIIFIHPSNLDGVLIELKQVQ